MGCDFQISGFEPDLARQARCVEFLKQVTSCRDLREVTAEYEPLARLVRGVTPVFRLPRTPEMLAIADSYPGASPWHPEALFGVVLSGEEVEWSFAALGGGRAPVPLCVVFDRERGGALCKVVAPWADTNLDEGFSTVGELRLGLGSYARLPTGELYYHVLFHFLRARYLRNLWIDADYDVEVTAEILERAGIEERLAGTAEAALPVLPNEAVSRVVTEYARRCDDAHDRRAAEESEREAAIAARNAAALARAPGLAVTPVATLDLGERARQVLARANLTTVGAILALGSNGLRRQGEMGSAMLREIASALGTLGLDLPAGEDGSDDVGR